MQHVRRSDCGARARAAWEGRGDPNSHLSTEHSKQKSVSECGSTGRLPSAALPLVDIPPGSASMHWASVCMVEVHMMWQAHDGGPRADRLQAPAAALALSKEPALNLLSNTNASTQRAPIALEGTGCCVFSPHTRVQPGVCVEDGVGKAAMNKHAPKPKKACTMHRTSCCTPLTLHPAWTSAQRTWRGEALAPGVLGTPSLRHPPAPPAKAGWCPPQGSRCLRAPR